MVIFETKIVSDLSKPVQVKPLSGCLFSGDNSANKITVTVMDGDTPAQLSGTVYGYVIREDNATVVITGSLVNNEAVVILPAAVCHVVGKISIVVKVGTVTIGACTTSVYRTSTDALVDPDDIIPSIDELLEKIADCEQATEDANDAADLAEEKAELADTAAQAADDAAYKIDNMTVSATGGSTAGATISEVDGHKHIGFTLPKGDDGNPGYVHIRYSANQPTSDSDMTTTPSDWMGVYSGSSATAPTSYTSYEWNKVKGETGSVSNVFGNNIPMTSTDPTTVKQAIDGKINTQQSVTDAGKALGINSQGIVEPVPFSGDDFTGATATTPGVHGYVPAPAITERTKFLCGDGTWSVPEGGKLVTFDLGTITNTSGSCTHTTVISDVTHDMKAVIIEVSDPDAFNDRIVISTADGSVTLTCADMSGTSDVTISCMFVANASTITSSEFDTLANRIGTLSSLQTTNKSDLVSAVNEVVGNVGTVSGNVGNLSSLTTTAKNNLVSAVNEVKGYAKTNSDISLTAKVGTSTFEHSVVRVGNVVTGHISIVTTGNTGDSVTMVSGFPAPRRNPQLPVWAVSGTQAGKRVLIDANGNMMPWLCSGVPAGNYIINVSYIAV